MTAAEVVALGFGYPSPDSLERLRPAVEALSGPARRPMSRFVDAMDKLGLSAWEELHTTTLDLSPSVVPYVGFVTWGENYRRGEFMADLKRDMEFHGIDLGGELPDHLDPVLRYLAVAPDPLSDLVEILPDAIDQMRSALAEADPRNPYRHLFSATATVISKENPVAIGGRP